MNKWICFLKSKIGILRPSKLVLSAAPVIIGGAMAFGDGIEHWPSFFIVFLGAMMLHIAINLPKELKFIKTLCFMAVIPSCIYLILRARLPVGIIGVIIIVIGFLHTSERFTLKFAGLDDLSALCFFGPFTLAVTYYSQSFEMNTAVLLAGIAPGLFGVSVLTIANIYDYEKDRLSGKPTMAVKYGKNFAMGKYLFSVLCASLTPVFIFNITHDHFKTLPAVVVSLLAIPTIVNILAKTDQTSLARARMDTIKLLMIYTVLFCWGWIV